MIGPSKSHPGSVGGRSRWWGQGERSKKHLKGSRFVMKSVKFVYLLGDLYLASGVDAFVRTAQYPREL